MTAPGRLLWIETRRSAAMLLFPFLVGLSLLAWFIRNQDSAPGIVVWPDVSENIGFGALFLGPAAGGLAAWVAGRDRRSNLGDLLQSTPRAPSVRQFGQLTGTMLWILLAYGTAALALAGIAIVNDSWGEPVPAPVVVGLLAIGAQAAIGYLAGTFNVSPIQSRLVAALVPVALFLAEIAPTFIRGEDVSCGQNCWSTTYPYENLSPIGVVVGSGGSIFWKSSPDVVLAAYAWLGGIALLALALIAMRTRPRSIPVLVVATVALGMATFGGMALVPAQAVETPAASRAIAYEPVCVQRSIAICLHPAYESVLSETADIIDPVVRPLAGIPGAPLRAEQVRPPHDRPISGLLMTDTPDTIGAEPADGVTVPRFIATITAVGAVRTGTAEPIALNPAQSAIAVWLMRQAGWESPEGIGPFLRFEAETSRDAYDLSVAAMYAAVDRFAALGPEERHAWLEANFAALRAGDVALEDLP